MFILFIIYATRVKNRYSLFVTAPRLPKHPLKFLLLYDFFYSTSLCLLAQHIT